MAATFWALGFLLLPENRALKDELLGQLGPAGGGGGSGAAAAAAVAAGGGGAEPGLDPAVAQVVLFPPFFQLLFLGREWGS